MVATANSGVMVVATPVVVCLLLLSCSVSCDQIKQGIIPLNATLFANATSADQTSSWLSANTTFVLGFFTPASAHSNSSNITPASRILAIWFQNTSSLTVVWMANRNTPVDAHSYFCLTAAGQFSLVNGSSVVAWSTQSYSALSSLVIHGEFQQSGNLLLRNRTSKDVLWQSFDHPTDTLLPGQQFSLTSSALRSWQSPSDPRTGNFLLAMNSSNNLEMYFVLTGAEYWTSDQFTLISFPSGSATAEFNHTGALNIAVNSTMLQSYKASDCGSNTPNLRRRLTLNIEGNFAMYTWSEAEGAWLMVWRALSDACQVRGVCGNGICTSPNASDLSHYVCSCPQGFLRNDSQDWTQGCFRQIPLPSCNSTPNASLTVQMHSFDNVNYLGPASFIDQVASTATCGALCLQNCSCVCASYGSDRVCWIHTDMHYGAQSDHNQTYTFLLKLAQKSSALLEGPAANGHHRSLLLPSSAIAGTCFAALAASILFILLAWLLFMQRERSKLKKLWSLRQSSGLPIQFSYKELEHATDNFNSKHKLGSGGFGTVFKGVLAGDKSTIAVKKLHSSSERGEEAQFQAEVSTIGSIYHVNIVRLRGFCCEGQHRILVYEYMQKGSLDMYLLDKSKSAGKHDQALGWKTRFNIALGVAKGIAYCHEQCRSRIIHCDIKPENVLLDDDYSPKVSDFGLAKLVTKSQTRVFTAIRGTRGYVAPEWVANLPVTVKADVYSYGMLLLEVIGWRRNLDLCVDSLDKLYYPHWAFHHLMERDLVTVANEGRITSGFDEDELDRALQVAFWCIQDESTIRPSMGNVMQMLEGTLPVSKPPPPKVLEIVMHEMKDESIKGTLDEANLETSQEDIASI